MRFFCTTRKKHICPYLIFDIFLYICNFFPQTSAWIMTKHILYLYLYLFLYFTSLNTSRRIVFARRSCWWEEVVKKITSQEGKFFTLFVDCYCKTILKEMLMCWCWCTESIYKTFLYLLSQSNLENAQCALHICYVYKELKFLKRLGPGRRA